jgi:hypothetical protein
VTVSNALSPIDVTELGKYTAVNLIESLAILLKA